MSKVRVFSQKEVQVGFIPLQDRELPDFLTDAARTHAKVELSVGPPGSHPQTRILGKSETLEVSKDFKSLLMGLPKALTDSPLLRGNAEILAVIFLKGSSLLCLHSSNFEVQEETLRLSAPWRVLKFQRRTATRFEIPSGYEYYANVSVSSKLMVRILDLSPLGMSLLATPEQAAKLPKGTFADPIEFRLDGHLVSLNARVMRQTREPKGIRVGLEFQNARQEDLLLISAFVARNLAQYAN